MSKYYDIYTSRTAPPNPALVEVWQDVSTAPPVFKRHDGTNWVGIGTKGDPGVKGDTGTSAYQAWILAGNTGTEAQFLASLVGQKGEQGRSFVPDASGPLTERALHDAQAKGFSFLDSGTGLLYFKNSATSGDWSAGVQFGKGDKGDPGPPGTTTWGGITDKPASFPPSAHRSTHAAGGSDPLAAVDIGASPKDFVSVADFGASPVRTPAENRAAIQAAVDRAQTLIKRSNFFAHSPVVYFPFFDDVLLIDGTITVSEPIVLRMASRYAPGVKITTDAPAFTVQAPLRVTGNANYVEDQRATFSEMCIRGTFDSAMPNQDGIRQIAPADRHIPRFTVENCVIRDMGGKGIYSTDAVSNRFLSTIIHRCHGDGILLTGIYNTDFYIHDCRLRICARGLNVSPAINPNTGVPYRFSTGFVGGGTVIEGNCLGTGALGSSTKPGAGIRMVSVADMAIQNVYFEGHLNDIHGDDWRGVVIEGAYHSAGSNNAPKTYFGGASPARRPCAMHITNAANKNNVIRNSWIYKPRKPADTTDTEWGTASYGTTYAHLPVLQGGPWVLDRPKEESTDAEILHSGGPSLVTHVRAVDHRYPAGSGPVLQSADGASTKRVTLNSAGTGFVFVDAS